MAPSKIGLASRAAAGPTADEVRDKLDDANIQQLHQAVIQFGTNCFELKKLCITVLFAAATLIATLTDKQLDTAFFVGSLITLTAFWLLDAQSYYYQDKLRARMKKLAERIALRHELADSIDGVGMPLSEKRENRSTFRRVAVALFNWSMSFYAAIGAVVLLLRRFVLPSLITATSTSTYWIT